jgi:co-chaperonin GroES (HSP10)
MMSTESFQKEFGILRELGEKVFKLRGSTMIVELIPDQELKTKGGIIIATDSDQRKGNSVEHHKLAVGRVLMTGEGYWNEEMESYEPLEVNIGAVVVLPQFSTQFISMFPAITRPTGNKICLVKYDQILAYYPTEEAYELAKTKLNG